MGFKLTLSRLRICKAALRPKIAFYSSQMRTTANPGINVTMRQHFLITPVLINGGTHRMAGRAKKVGKAFVNYWQAWAPCRFGVAGQARGRSRTSAVCGPKILVAVPVGGLLPVGRTSPPL